MCMHLEPIKSEVSQTEGQTLCSNTDVWNLEKWYWWTYLQARNRDVDAEKGHVNVVKGRGMGGTGRLGLTYIHYHVWNRQLVGSCCIITGSSNRCSVMTWSGGMGEGESFKREGIYVYVWLIHFAVQQWLIQRCTAIILQLKKGINI